MTEIDVMDRRLNSIFSFEAAFFLFMFSGIYSSSNWFGLSSSIFTMVAAVLSFVSGIYVLYTNNWQLSNAAILCGGIYFSFIAWMTLTILWSPSKAYAIDKAVRLGTITAWAILGPSVVIAYSSNRLTRFLKITSTGAVIISIVSIYKYYQGVEGSLTLLGSNHIILGRLMGAGTIIFTYFLLTSKTKYKNIIFFGGAGVTTIGLLLSGSRGPTVAMISGIVSYLLLEADIKSTKLRVSRYHVGVASILSVSWFLLPLSVKFNNIRSTIPVLAESSDIYSMELPRSLAKRIDFWRYAIDMWLSSPLVGKGIGSFAVLYFETDSSLYPHNILAEVAAESGAIGLLLFSSLTLLGVMRSKCSRTEFSSFLLAFFVYWLVNAMFSLDVAGNRQLFMSVGMLFITSSKFSRNK